MKVTVKDNQTIYDIALQYAGSIEAVIDILEANGKKDTTLLIGEELVIPNVITQKVAQFYESSNVNVATSSTPLQVDEWVPPAGLNRAVTLTVNGLPYVSTVSPFIFDIEVLDGDGVPINFSIVDGKIILSDIHCIIPYTEGLDYILDYSI